VNPDARSTPAVESWREGDAAMRALFDQSDDAMIVVDDGGRVVAVNASTCSLLGQPEQTIVGAMLSSWIGSDADLPAALRTLLDVGSVRGLLPIVGPGALRRLVDYRGVARIAEGRHLLVIRSRTGPSVTERDALANDITELRHAEELGRTLVQSSPAAIFALDHDARVSLWNPAAERVFGWSAEEVEGRPPPFLTAETAEAFVESVRAGEGVEAGDATYHRRDGGAVEVTLSRAPLRDRSGAVRGAVGILFDMTDRRMLEDQLRHARKMEVVGRFAGGIAHDFNNMLQVISGFASVARYSLPAEHVAHAELEQILRASSRAAQLTRQLLAFSRRQLTQSRVLDLNALVGDMHRMLERLIGEHVRLEVRLDPSARRVRGDVGQLEQVLLNLCVNARDAMPDGGELTLSVAPARLDLDEARRHPEVAAGGYVALRVTDTGTGMDAATLERAFDPFFSTKETGQGTGLGLATVYGIVRQSGGEVWLSSEPGRGTTVTICLPGTHEAAQSIRPPPQQARCEGRGEMVLVVEDEALVRRLTVQLLQRHGYKVIEATDGHEGLRAYESSADQIRLVLTDVVMPGMDGVEMSRRITRRFPEARTLYMTAWSGDALPVTMERYAAVLDKPFTTDGLLSAVRTALDRPTA